MLLCVETIWHSTALHVQHLGSLFATSLSELRLLFDWIRLRAGRECLLTGWLVYDRFTFGELPFFHGFPDGQFSLRKARIHDVQVAGLRTVPCERGPLT